MRNCFAIGYRSIPQQCMFASLNRGIYLCVRPHFSLHRCFGESLSMECPQCVLTGPPRVECGLGSFPDAEHIQCFVRQFEVNRPDMDNL